MYFLRTVQMPECYVTGALRENGGVDQMRPADGYVAFGLRLFAARYKKVTGDYINRVLAKIYGQFVEQLFDFVGVAALHCGGVRTD